MALKYPKVSPEVMRRVIIPEAADECARERAANLWSPSQYRDCLRARIRAKIRAHAGGR